MKYLKTFEQFDSPELKGTFTPQDIRAMTFADSPWVGDYKKFQYGSYSGEPSVRLNQSISDARRKRYGGAYGFSTMMYPKIVKAVPQLKDFECNNGYEDEKDFELHFKKEKELTDKPGYTACIELWVKFHPKSDKIFRYKKNKIYVLFVTKINKIQKSNNLFDVMKDPKREENGPLSQLMDPKRNPLSDQYVEPTPEEQKKEDELWNKVIDNMFSNMRGSVDDEDLSYYDSLKVKAVSISMDTFMDKTLPKIKENIEIFEKYIKNKFSLTF